MSDDEIAKAIHYPECWDTAAYPTLASALFEMVDQPFVCNEDHCPQRAQPSDKLPQDVESWIASHTLQTGYQAAEPVVMVTPKEMRTFLASLQPKRSNEGFEDVKCHKCGQSTMHIGDTCYSCSHEAIAALQGEKE